MRLPGGYEIRPVRCPDCNTWGVAFDWSGHWGWAVGWRLRLRGWRHPVRARRWQAGAKGLRAFEGGGYSIDWSRLVTALYDLTPPTMPFLTQNRIKAGLFTYAELKLKKPTEETADA